MFEIIERVRQKKDKEKKIIAFSVAFSVCLVIFTFWAFTVLPEFKKQEELEKKVQSAKNGPSANIAGFVADNFNQVKDQFSKLKEFSGVFEGTADYYVATSSPQQETIPSTTTPTLMFGTTTVEKTP